MRRIDFPIMQNSILSRKDRPRNLRFCCIVFNRQDAANAIGQKTVKHLHVLENVGRGAKVGRKRCTQRPEFVCGGRRRIRGGRCRVHGCSCQSQSRDIRDNMDCTRVFFVDTHENETNAWHSQAVMQS